jgi:hypothetical protein
LGEEGVFATETKRVQAGSFFIATLRRAAEDPASHSFWKGVWEAEQRTGLVNRDRAVGVFVATLRLAAGETGLNGRVDDFATRSTRSSFRSKERCNK